MPKHNQLEDVIRRLREDFEKSLCEKVREFESALYVWPVDWENAGFLAHRFKGASGTYGFHSLAEHFGKLEDAVNSRALQSLTPESAMEFLRHWLEGLRQETQRL